MEKYLYSGLIAVVAVIIAQNLPVLQDYVSGQKRLIGA